MEIHLKTGFIQSSQSPTTAPIYFDKKPDGSHCLYVDYQGFNNLTIKNRYSLPLIGEGLDWLGRAKPFNQLDLTSAYHRIKIEEGDKCKTVFRTKYGHFEYKGCPFPCPTHSPILKTILTKSLLKNLIFLLWCIWITF